MKKIFLIPILFFLFNTVEAQKKKSKQPVIKYQEFDYLQDTNVVYKNKEPLHSRVGIKIKNINKKLVDINKDIQKTSFNEAVPALFETFAKTSAPAASPGAAALALADLNLFNSTDIAVANIHDSVKRKLNTVQVLYSNTGREMIRMQSILTAYGGDYTHVKAVLQYHSDLALLQYACKRTFSDILNDVNKLTSATFYPLPMGVDAADRFLLNNNSHYVQNKGIINRYITKITGDAELHYNDINASFLPGRVDKLSADVQKINTTLAELEIALKRTVRPNANVTAILEVIAAELINVKLGRELDDLKYNYNKFDFTKLQKNIETFATTGKTELFAVYDFFNESNFTYYVNPEAIDKDLTVINVNIVPKENVPCDPGTRSYEVSIRSKRGIKIDFSTGLFANFGGNNFMDQSYSYDTIAGQPDKYSIKRNKPKNSIFPAVGALMHIYWRTGNDIHFSGAFGISTKDLDKINYHLGGSLIFGYSQRFILSSGLTLTKANLIADKYQVGQVIDKQGAPADIPTSSYNRVGYFLSFTYNLTAK